MTRVGVMEMAALHLEYTRYCAAMQTRMAIPVKLGWVATRQCGLLRHHAS